MRTELVKKINMFKVFNDITLKNEIVIFGSSFFALFPFYELSKKYLLPNAIYNRSIEGITVAEANNLLEEAVLDAKPSKVFFAFENCNTSDMLTSYKEIISKTKKALPLSSLYVIEFKTVDTSLNKQFELLCKESNVKHIEIDSTKTYQAIFKQLSPFFRSQAISFEEAFHIE